MIETSASKFETSGAKQSGRGSEPLQEKNQKIIPPRASCRSSISGDLPGCRSWFRASGPSMSLCVLCAWVPALLESSLFGKLLLRASPPCMRGHSLSYSSSMFRTLIFMAFHNSSSSPSLAILGSSIVTFTPVMSPSTLPATRPVGVSGVPADVGIFTFASMMTLR